VNITDESTSATEAQPALVTATGTGSETARRGVVFTDDGPRLVGSTCSACATTSWPPAVRCHSCWEPVESLTLSDTGKLYAFTRVHVASPGTKVPYVVGYVDLPEGVRVFTKLHGEFADLGIDDTVKLYGSADEDFWFAVA
jgi:uncharacterized OB-fold protein